MIWLLNLRDLLTFGLAAVAATVAAISVWYAKGGAPGVISTLAALAMWAIYFRARIWPRWKLLRSVTFTTRHGIRVILEGADWPIAAQQMIESATGTAIDAWTAAGVPALAQVQILSGSFVTFTREVFTTVKGLRCQGVLFYASDVKRMMVVWHDPVTSSAFGHELGHLILRESGKAWDEPALKAWADKTKDSANPIPY